jgi:hypothetical protein
MLILDNLLLSPLLWIFREINESVQKEQAGEAEAITRSLSELYMKLDTGAITEQEFEAEETLLLDRLDAIRERDEAQAEDGEGDEDGEEDEESEEEEEEEENDEEEVDEEEDIETQAGDLPPADTGKV